MRYFSLASRCRILHQINVRRSVSYKLRLSLTAKMANIMTSVEPEVQGTIPEKSCTNFNVSVMANGACGSGGVTVTSNSTSYLFNFGEGQMRLCLEHCFKLKKVSSIFLTYPSWKFVGGVTGLCLTLQSMGTTDLVIYGPPKVKNLILGLRAFATLKHVTPTIITDKTKFLFNDGNIKVQFVPIYPDLEKMAVKTGSEATTSNEIEDDSGSEDLEAPSAKRPHLNFNLETMPNESYVLCYICETPELGTHLDIKECLKLGVPIGPLLGQLKKKQNVTLKNGKVIEWNKVHKNFGTTKIFLIVDCPGVEFLEPFVNEPMFVPYQGSSDNAGAASVVYHFTEVDILQTPKYREWMSRFPSTTKHILVNSENPILDHIAPYQLQEKLHLIDPVTFPKLGEDHIPEVREEYSGIYPKHAFVAVNDGEDKQADKSVLKSSNILESEFVKHNLSLIENWDGINVMKSISTLRWTIFPESSYPFSHMMHFDRRLCVKEVMDIEKIQEDLEKLKDLKRAWESGKEYEALPEYPKILFLGTGCSHPHPLRNTSGILVELQNGVLVLLDCGEGTYGQMLRFFGKDKIVDIMKRLRLIFVSHQHADHHLGLINILTARYHILSNIEEKEYKPESNMMHPFHLLMILPGSVRDWITSMDKEHPLLYDTKIIATTMSLQVNPYSLLKKYVNGIGIEDLRMTMVPHSYESFGVSFITASGYRITYSGDTLPSDNLVELGKNSDLLIHEATFESGMESFANKKNHSTINQALRIGMRMKAKFVILTHFSQRYHTIPQLRLILPSNAAIAFDNMMVTPRMLPFLTNFEPMYKKVFAETVDLLNNITERRVYREERKAKKKQGDVQMRKLV